MVISEIKTNLSLRLFAGCWRLGFVPVINTDESKLGRKGFTLAYHHLSKSGQELQAGTWRQDLKHHSWKDTAYWLDHYYCSVRFLTQPSGACALPHHLESKKMPHRHVHGPIWKRQFFSWDPLFPDMLEFVVKLINNKLTTDRNRSVLCLNVLVLFPACKKKKKDKKIKKGRGGGGLGM